MKRPCFGSLSVSGLVNSTKIFYFCTFLVEVDVAAGDEVAGLFASVVAFVCPEVCLAMAGCSAVFVDDVFVKFNMW